jgi:hypothetical protein
MVKNENKGSMFRVYSRDQSGRPQRTVMGQRSDEQIGRYSQYRFLTAWCRAGDQVKVVRGIKPGIIDPEGTPAAKGNGEQPLMEPGYGADPSRQRIQKEGRSLARLGAEGDDGSNLHRSRTGVRGQRHLIFSTYPINWSCRHFPAPRG